MRGESIMTVGVMLTVEAVAVAGVASPSPGAVARMCRLMGAKIAPENAVWGPPGEDGAVMRRGEMRCGETWRLV